MTSIKLSFLILFTCGILSRNSLGLSPVILIPGDGGSQLEAKLNKTNVVHYICAKTSPDYFNIWLNLELLVPFVIDCWVDNLKLEYDNVTRTTKGPSGVDIRIPGWGNPEPVEWLDPSHQNENGKFFADLKTMVENTYNANNKSSVTLLVHSMGGLMAMHFLRLQPQAWKDQYIRRLISLSTPWGGSMKAVKVFAIGDDLGSLMLRESIMRAQQITCPSLAWLLPSPLFWKPTEVLVQTDKYNYTINDFQRLFTLVYKPGTWLDGYPTLAMGDGDGTVNLRSLNACEHWRKKRFRNGNSVKSLALPGAEHLKILHDKRVLDYIQLVMKN
ncbi:hypothetical protein HF086_008237 [Spodoptera exigua]|uniref:Group XV phospholipase A2 n=1 Tax=Spodoptera exigua TaxID=7107 RepID=A0A922SGI4_SPOEX|nr:hypothetical protein HF086_008237 [Spodoptera exigua]